MEGQFQHLCRRCKETESGAILALRILEREGLVIAARYGKNTLIWQKTTPRPLPEWI